MRTSFHLRDDRPPTYTTTCSLRFSTPIIYCPPSVPSFCHHLAHDCATPHVLSFASRMSTKLPPPFVPACPALPEKAPAVPQHRHNSTTKRRQIVRGGVLICLTLCKLAGICLGNALCRDWLESLLFTHLLSPTSMYATNLPLPAVIV